MKFKRDTKNGEITIAPLIALLLATFIGGVLNASASAAAAAVTCFTGAWSSTTTYAPGEVVTYNGANYVSLVKNTNTSPLSSFSDWSILDASAAKGPACVRGS